MGLLSGPQVNPVRPWMQGAQAPMQPQMSQGLTGAFSQIPQFQQQLQALLQQQGPGSMPVQYTPPPAPIPLTMPGGPSFGMGDQSMPSVLGINRFRGR